MIDIHHTAAEIIPTAKAANPPPIALATAAKTAVMLEHIIPSKNVT